MSATIRTRRETGALPLDIVAGYTTKEPDPKNGREVLIATTPAGDKLRGEAGCLAERLIEASGVPVEAIIDLKRG